MASATPLGLRLLGKQKELGSHHCWNRTYDLFMGRWTTPDPAASPWTNLWSYAEHTPVQVSDPSGLFSISPIGVRIKETFVEQLFGDDNDDGAEDAVWDAFKKILEADGHTVKDDTFKHDVDIDARRTDVKDAMKRTKGDDVFIYIGHGNKSGVQCFKPIDEDGDRPNELEDSVWSGDDFDNTAQEVTGAAIILSCDSKSLSARFKNAKVRVSFAIDSDQCSTFCVSKIAHSVARSLTKDGTWFDLVNAVNADASVPQACKEAKYKLKCEPDTKCLERVFPKYK